MMQGAELPYGPLGIAAYSLRASLPGESSVLVAEYGKKSPSVSLYATSDLPYRTSQARTAVPSPV
jgi:hypothetical protein